MTYLTRFFTWVHDFYVQLDERWHFFENDWRIHANRRTILILIFLGALMGYLYTTVIQPAESFPVDKLVTITPGESLTEISNSLENEGVVRSAFGFRVVAVLLGNARTLHSGDYIFKTPLDIVSVARRMAVGAFGLEPVKVRIPEGATTREMAVIFALRLERFNQANFLAQAQPLEGYLFPDTYYFLPNANENTVIQAMRQNFDEHEKTIDIQIQSSGHSLSDIVIMASILEKEANNPADRRMIAGVLWNRIRKGMPLQVDATFLYTLGKGSFQLTMKDLRSDSPYNTYKNKGLPPGPINSPSLDSILDAATPTKSNYLYYLADSNGVTHYSATYQQHLSNKTIYIDNAN